LCDSMFWERAVAALSAASIFLGPKSQWEKIGNTVLAVCPSLLLGFCYSSSATSIDFCCLAFVWLAIVCSPFGHFGSRPFISAFQCICM